MHDLQGEYNLVFKDYGKECAQKHKYSNQKELDDLVRKQAEYWLKEAYNILQEILKISRNLTENADKYPSIEHYNEVPFWKIDRNRMPKKKD